MGFPTLTFTLFVVLLCPTAEASPSKRCIHNSQGLASTSSPCSHHTTPVATLTSSETIGVTTTSSGTIGVTSPSSWTIGPQTSSSSSETVTETTPSSYGTIGLSSECGMLSGTRPAKRVVGGNTTNPHEWPSICRLEPLGCGGTLIKNRIGQFYIITAAHCTLRHPDPKKYKVRCGVHNLKGDSPSHEQTLEVANIIDHEKYLYNEDPNNSIVQHDISILELKKQPHENDFVKAACLPSVEVHTGEAAFVAGWGFISAYWPWIKTDELQDLAKPIVSNEECEAVYNNAALYNYTNVVFDQDLERDGMFCAGHTSPGKGSCRGDSGGPLYTERDGRWTLAGVVSYGTHDCGREHFVDVYADVYRYLDWINSKINNN